MADSLLSFGVEKLWDLLVRESERFQGVEEQFNELKSDLNMLRGFLEDADAKKHISAMVRNIVKEIKEIVYDTEDIVETFLLEEELGKTSGIRNTMRRFSKRRELAIDMKAISKRISKVNQDMQNLGVQKVIVDERDTQSLLEIQREMRQTFSSDNEDHLVGLRKNVKKLVGYLVEEDSSQVLSITGMPGIGKTTLARQVFNHETVKSHFARLAWVCVSQQFTRKYVWQTILRKLRPECKVPDMTEDELQEKLSQALKTQKALIVLDDIWREEDWDRIKAAFPRGKGLTWRLLLTSRNEGVALRADPTCFTFKPDCLTPEKSWTLFQRIAFPTENTTEYEVDEKMEKMGKQMIKQCGGLPLSIKVLGGLLAAQYTLHDWKRINENTRSHIVGGTSFNEKNISSVYHALYLSFEELPVYLKHCFFYLAYFPEDYPIDVEKLSYYWAAERIRRPMHYDGASTREVADGYIEELVKRNMVISERDVSTSRFETCQLHDMMREVCLRKVQEENFIHILDRSHVTSTTTSQSPCKSRRLVIHSCDDISHMEGYIQNPRLRSLLLLNSVASSLCFTELQLMRILDLSYAKFEGGKLPSEIRKLVHLRYLSLYMAKVSHLPSSMRHLRKLFYLNLFVDWESAVDMPNIMKEMRELRYLYLPREMHDKTKLELGNLVNLETLMNFSTENSNVKDLQLMTKLRSLSIYIRDKGCNTETLSASLSKLIHLEDLTICDLHVDTRTNNEEGFILDFGHLKQLDLTIYMPKLLDEQHFPSHLTTINLEGCRLVEDPMPILEKLLQLEKLNFGHEAYFGRRMVCSGGGFPKLQEFSMTRLEEWEEWIVEQGSMPLLHTLTIWKCPKLKELPDGLRFIYSLKKLILNEEWKERLSERGADYYKVQHIPFLWCSTYPYPTYPCPIYPCPTDPNYADFFSDEDPNTCNIM